VPAIVATIHKGILPLPDIKFTPSTNEKCDQYQQTKSGSTFSFRLKERQLVKEITGEKKT
jgi:hypothetical protein